MANYTSSKDIINAALSFAGELTNPQDSDYVSEYRPRALQYLNRISTALLSGSNEFELDMGEPFGWAVAADPKVIILEPTLYQNVALVTDLNTGLFLTPPLISYVGKYLRIQNSQEFYKILTHNVGTGVFTMDSIYLAETNASAQASIYTLEYSLGTDVCRLISRGRINQFQPNASGGMVLGTDLSEMLRVYPLVMLQTKFPDRYAVVNWNTNTGDMVIRVNTTSPFRARMEIPYVPVGAPLTDDNTSIPLIPIQYRIIMAYGVAFYLCQDKNDDRAQNYLALVKQGLASIIEAEKRQATDINPDRARVIPRTDRMGYRLYPWWWRGWY